MSGKMEDDWIKNNLLQLAREHKVKCNPKTCHVSLTAVRIALKKLNIKLTEEESKELI
jgi:hypothetical protein